MAAGVEPLRVAVLSELPTPYRWPLHRKVAAEPGLDVTVLFYARTEADRDWGLDVEADAARDGRPRVEFLRGRALAVRGRRSLFFHWNPSVWRRLREGRFEVVVVPGWSMPTSLLAALACRLRRVPYVLFSETHALRRRPWWLRAVKRIALRPLVGGASAWLATGSLSEAYLRAHGAREGRVFRFANTPDVAALREAVLRERPRRGEVRAELGVPPEGVLVLFVGRLIAAKGPGTLVAAQALLERDLGDRAPWLVLAGEGPEEAALRAAASREGLRRVRFAGSRRPAELPALYAAADAFALPSTHEPWGVVVNEAMAAGLPVVLSDRVGAAADLLVDGVNGRLVPAADPRALAQALTELAQDAGLRRRMGEESQRMVVSDWDHGPSVRGFVEAVRTAAGRRP